MNKAGIALSACSIVAIGVSVFFGIRAAYSTDGRYNHNKEEKKIEPNSIHSIEDISGKHIGAQVGTTGYTFILDSEEGAIVEPYKTGEDGIKDLIEGKIDAVILDSAPAKEFAKMEEYADKIQILDEAYALEEYSIGYSKDNEELGRKVNDAITVLRQKGTLQEIESLWVDGNPNKIYYQPSADNNGENGTLRMVTNAEFPPYESKDEDGNLVGFDIDMMYAVCDQMGYKLEITDTDFSNVIRYVENGNADVAVAGISVTPERQEQVNFTQTYATTEQVIITRAD